MTGRASIRWPRPPIHYFVFSNRKDAIMPADVKDLVSFVLVHLIMAVLVTAFLV